MSKPEYYTCAKCTHPYAIVGQHQCLTTAVENLVKVAVLKTSTQRVLRAHAKATSDILSAARRVPASVKSEHPQRLSVAIEFERLVKEWNAPACSFERANEIIDRLVEISQVWAE